MYKICVFIPETHLSEVKTAMFEAGAGKIGHYDHCSWQTLGVGQFRPLDNSKPFMGRKDEIKTVNEYKVEMICEGSLLKTVITAMKNTHPYEIPAYDVLALANL